MCGGYELFTSQESFETTSQHIDKFNSWMNELLDEELVYKTDELNGYPVIYNRLEGALHPGKMMQNLIEVVCSKGIEIKWNTTVAEVTTDGDALLTDGSVIKAAKILVATNGFAQKILSEIEIKPARGFIFVTNEISGMPWQGTFSYDRGYIFFRNVGERLLIGGARNLAVEEETTDQFGTNSKIKEHLIHFVEETLKPSANWQIDYEWSGIMGFTSTKTPVVEQVDERRYIAAGMSGMGIAIGTEIGKLAAGLLTTSKI
jgi:glycine/D-amino acid oxidase-like deaminating enzyme